jgi:hypothetical protein
MGAGAALGGGVGSAVSSLQALYAELLAQRAGLDGQLAAVAGALRAIGTTVAAPRAAALRVSGGGRGGWRTGSLKAHIAQVLRGGGVLAVKDITSGVMKSGYKTKNKTLAKSVGIALTEMRGVVKVGRGQFKLV